MPDPSQSGALPSADAMAIDARWQEEFAAQARVADHLAAERDRYREALEDAVQLNPGWRARALRVLDTVAPDQKQNPTESA